MKQPNPTQELPEQYQQINQFDLNDNRGLMMILNLTGLVLLFGIGWLLLQSLTFLRPVYLSEENILIITGLREFWRGVLLLVVSLGLMILLNESFRGIIFWVLTRQRPKLGFGGLFSYRTASEWYLPRRTYLLIRLLPLVLITFLGIAAIPWVPLNLVPGVLLLVSITLASSTVDFAIMYWLLRKPKSVLVIDDRDRVLIFDLQTRIKSHES